MIKKFKKFLKKIIKFKQIKNKKPENETLKNNNNENTQTNENDNNITTLYNGAVKIKKHELISLLKCPLCKGIFRTPTTINECICTLFVKVAFINGFMIQVQY